MRKEKHTMSENKVDKARRIGSFNGNFDYPSSRGLGVDVIHYQRRNPHPTERNPLPVDLKMRDLPHLIAQDLRDAARVGELRSELNRHIELLQKYQYADEATIKLLRGCESDLTGPGCDSDQVDTICGVIGTLTPTEVKP
jgi:hypothetical protein